MVPKGVKVAFCVVLVCWLLAGCATDPVGHWGGITNHGGLVQIEITEMDEQGRVKGTLSIGEGVRPMFLSEYGEVEPAYTAPISGRLDGDNVFLTAGKYKLYFFYDKERKEMTLNGSEDESLMFNTNFTTVKIPDKSK